MLNSQRNKTARTIKTGIHQKEIFLLEIKTKNVIKAQITKLEGFSGHGDYKEMIDYFTRSLQVEGVQRVFVVHGEQESAEAYKDHLYEAGFRGIEVPEKGEIVHL